MDAIADQAAAEAQGRALAESIFANEADPAFRRRAIWIAGLLGHQFSGRHFTVADIGCGRGFYFPLYHQLGATIIGVERDAEPLAMARLRAQSLEATVLEAGAERVPLDDETVDVVVMSEILEHLPSPSLALAEARRILVPGGWLLVTVPNANYPFLWDPINWVLEATIRRPIRSGPLAGIWANHERLYTAPQLTAEIEASGFDIDNVVHHTRYCMPFVHNVVYGLGKPLLERRMLPRNWATSAERGTSATARAFNPVAIGIRVIQFFDRRNKPSEPADVPTLNVCVSARSTISVSD